MNEDTLFNTIAMVRQSTLSPLLVVEGSDDHFILSPHSAQGLSLLAGVGGKPAVLGAADLAEARRVTGVRFLIDVDYDKYLQPFRTYSSLVIETENHDLTMDVVFGGVHILDRVIETHARSAARRDETVLPESLRIQAMNLAATTAPLRIANEELDLGLNLKDFPFGKLSSSTPSSGDLAAVALERSNSTLLPEHLAQLLERESALLSLNDQRLIGDHDFFRALSFVLRLTHSVTSSPDSLLNSYISALTCAPMMRTRAHEQISAWCAENGKTAFSCPCAA